MVSRMETFWVKIHIFLTYVPYILHIISVDILSMATKNTHATIDFIADSQKHLSHVYINLFINTWTDIWVDIQPCSPTMSKSKSEVNANRHKEYTTTNRESILKTTLISLMVIFYYGYDYFRQFGLIFSFIFVSLGVACKSVRECCLPMTCQGLSP